MFFEITILFILGICWYLYSLKKRNWDLLNIHKTCFCNSKCPLNQNFSELYRKSKNIQRNISFEGSYPRFRTFNQVGNYSSNFEANLGDVNVNHLPDEILVDIFSFLTIQEILLYSRVCKKWYNLGKVGILWSRLTFYKQMDHQKFFNIIESNPKCLISLDLSELKDFSFSSLARIVYFFFFSLFC